jgi:hypothetical protein
LQNNRPIRANIGLVNTDNSLEMVNEFWYNNESLKIGFLFGVFDGIATD